MGSGISSHFKDFEEANLGKPFYVEQVTPTAIRVIDVDGTPRLEVSYTGSATLNGIKITDFGTYQELKSDNGSFYSEGRGVFRADNSESASYISHTVGRSTADAKWIDRGTLIFSASPGTQLSFLNNLIAVFKDEAPKGASVRNSCTIRISGRRCRQGRECKGDRAAVHPLVHTGSSQKRVDTCFQTFKKMNPEISEGL